MKIGIITYANASNYGALLQAYALQTFLECRGHEVVLLNYAWTHKYSIWQIIRSRRLSTLCRKAQENINRSIADGFRKHLHLSSLYDTVADVQKHFPKCDVYIVGSDQVWNTVANRDKLQLVFLDFVDDSVKRLSYAVSFGLERINSELHKEVGRLMRKFSAISVRERTAVKLVKQVSGCHAEWLCDPTLLLSDDQYRKLAQASQVNVRSDARFIFSYFLSWSTANRDAYITCLKKALTIGFEKSEKARSTLWLGGMLGLHDKIEVSEWLCRVMQSSFVVTNSFHGTIFAILFQKPFITVLLSQNAAAMNDRIVSLLARLGLSDRMFDNFDERRLLTVVHSEINWEDVDKRIKDWRSETEVFFSKQEL
jgi:polysaccharide pyruvyl transferase WcaK-like protein